MFKTLGVMAIVLSTSLSSVAISHTGATGIVKERMAAMKSLGRHAKTVDKMFKGKSAFEHGQVVDAAEAFVLHGNEMLALFPDTEQSRTGKTTEALAKVWSDWDGFTIAVEKFLTSSESFQEAVKATKDEKTLRKAFLKAGKSCSSCHKKYRKPKA